MDPEEKCVAVLKAVACVDAESSLTVIRNELDAFVRAIGGEGEATARALSNLAENFNDQAPDTDTAAKIDAEISRRIKVHARSA